MGLEEPPSVRSHGSGGPDEVLNGLISVRSKCSSGSVSLASACACLSRVVETAPPVNHSQSEHLSDAMVKVGLECYSSIRSSVSC